MSELAIRKATLVRAPMSVLAMTLLPPDTAPLSRNHLFSTRTYHRTYIVRTGVRTARAEGVPVGELDAVGVRLPADRLATPSSHARYDGRYNEPPKGWP
jgi:hypothetical protein